MCECLDGGSEVDMSSPLNYGTPTSSRVGDTPQTPGALGTPHRSRADITSERRPTVAVGTSSELVIALLDQELKHIATHLVVVLLL